VVLKEGGGVTGGANRREVDEFSREIRVSTPARISSDQSRSDLEKTVVLFRRTSAL